MEEYTRQNELLVLVINYVFSFFEPIICNNHIYQAISTSK